MKSAYRTFGIGFFRCTVGTFDNKQVRGHVLRPYFRISNLIAKSQSNFNFLLTLSNHSRALICVYMTFFTTDVKISDLLFRGLNINNTEELVGACAVVLVATVAFEALKVLKTYLELRLNENPLSGVQHLQSHCSQASASPTPSNTHDEILLLSSLRIPVTVDQVRNRKICLHVLNTLSHMFNFFYGYMLMLVVMTYSVWLGVAVILGCGIGYWIFGAIGQTIQMHYKNFSSTTLNTDDDHHHSPNPSPQTVQACGDL
ncbi:hypothetical protein BaRGS_00004344 [Batillaria attramentaria]|uniref:Copper transport protein n=1 Tax=Batillaria attramentaria TaxID=370345 RepID=A0ABD0LZB8_9CAEN